MKTSLVAILLASITAVGCSQAGSGDRSQSLTIDSEGATSQGSNDTAANAQALSSLDATAFGYIDSEDDGDVDIYSFEVEGSESTTVYFDIDYANDVNTPDTDDDDGVDSVISVFDSDGELIEQADDVGFPADAGSDPNGDFDPFLELELEPGSYYVGISPWANYSEGSIDGYGDDEGLSSGQYCLQVRTSAGLDAPANDCSDAPDSSS